MDSQPDDEIIHRSLDTDVDQPVTQVAEIVAELDGKRQEELTTTFDHLDHVLMYVFTNPPVPEAQVEVTFSYEGYRITVEQDGSAQFVRTG